MTKRKDKRDVAKLLESLPEPTAEEAEAIKVARAANATRPARMRVKSDLKGNDLNYGPSISDGSGWAAMLAHATGSTSHSFTNAMIQRLEPVLRPRGSESAASDSAINAALALLASIEPANELEAAMGEQIVGAHTLSMSLLGKAQQTDTVDKMEAYINAATKLSRTMAGQVEALAKLRSGGKQQMVVKHVYVNGPAVVGDGVQAVFAGAEGGVAGGGGDGRNSGQSHAAGLLDAPSAALLCANPLGQPLPIASGERAETLPDARWDQPGRA